MGQRITYIDDLDGTDLGPDAKPTSFSVGGKRYSLYLSDENLEKFYDVLKPYTEAADVAYDHAPVKRASAKAAKDEPKHIRRWAEKNGIQHNGKPVTVNDRGRVPQDVRDAWVDAGSPVEDE
jgi:hypothetical protein